MRTELEQIKKIEQYLNGELSAEETAAFEESINKDPGLREEIRLQQEVMKGIERAALTQKVQQAARRFRRIRNFRNWGGAGLVVIVLIGAIFLVTKRPAQPSAPGLANPVATGTTGNSAAGGNIGSQLFSIDISRDTVIETKGGIVLSVPAGCFQDAGGQSVTGKINLVMREALDLAAIIKAGLSTRSGDRLLETAGMFYIEAFKDGKTLKIDPARSIYAEVPADTIRPGMQLFTGRPLTDGTIDWENPRPLEHYLNPVDVHLLNFYPPHYLDSLSKWGYNVRDKRFTDSLYFSFASLWADAAPPVTDTSIDWRPRVVPGCKVNPAKVKTIWSGSFQNTLIATREFEQRMQWIHQSGDALLDLYINHLDQDLSAIDSIAAGQLSGVLKARFLSFATRRDGKVKTGVRQLDDLSRYYATNAKIYTDAIAKTQNEFWDRQAQLDSEAGQRQFSHQVDSVVRTVRNFMEEFELNLKEACRQSGYNETLRPPAENAYQVQILATGWHNLDQYVMESLNNRTTLNFKNPQTGKTAVIKYLPVSFQFDHPNEYDRLYVYLLPDKLSSFMRIAGSGGMFSEKLNELMQYNLICIAYKGDQAFFYSREKIQSGTYLHLQMQPIGAAELDRELNKRGNKTQAADVRLENAFFQFEWQDRKRQQRNQALRELSDKVEESFFTCLIFYERPASQ